MYPQSAFWFNSTDCPYTQPPICPWCGMRHWPVTTWAIPLTNTPYPLPASYQTYITCTSTVYPIYQTASGAWTNIPGLPFEKEVEDGEVE